jgi:hypothetical protein
MIRIKNNKIEIAFFLLTLFVAAAASFLSYVYSTRMPYFTDDFDMVLPALNHMKGAAYPLLKYPTFPFIFYEFIFRIFSKLLISDTDYLYAGRLITVVLFGINIMLFYCVARIYLKRAWAFLAVLLFLFAPVIFYSGTVVKTEPLLLTELLICIICVEMISRKPGKTVWHIIAAVSCGLAITTKYNLMPLTTYLFAIMYSAFYENKSGMKAAMAGVVRNKNTWIFTAVFIAIILLTWTTIWDIGTFLQITSSDLYGLPYPTFFRSVDEFFSFPYGRYSYSLSTIIPFGMGIFNFVLALLAMIFRLIPRKLLVIWGGSSLLYLIFVQSITLARPPYLFTPMMPFLIICSVLFIRYFFSAGKKYFLKIAGSVLIITALIVSVIQFPALYNAVRGMVEAFRFAGSIGKSIVVLIHSEYTSIQGIDLTDFEGSINRIKPEYILTLDSYFYNFKKYDRPEYNKQFYYYEMLTRGQIGYGIEWQRPVNIPLKKLFIDPELSFTYTLFKRLY